MFGKPWIWIALAGVAGYVLAKKREALAEALFDDWDDEDLPDTPLTNDVKELNELWTIDEDESDLTKDQLDQMRRRYNAALKAILEKHEMESSVQDALLGRAWENAGESTESETDLSDVWHRYLRNVLAGAADLETVPSDCGAEACEQ